MALGLWKVLDLTTYILWPSFMMVSWILPVSLSVLQENHFWLCSHIIYQNFNSFPDRTYFTHFLEQILFRLMQTHTGSSPTTYSVCVTCTLARKMMLYSSLDNKEHLSPSQEPRNKFAWWQLRCSICNAICRKAFLSSDQPLGAKTLYHSGKAFGLEYSRVIISSARKTQE